MVESYFIAKVYRQHNSLVIVIPGVVCVAMNVKAGTYMVFTWDNDLGSFKFSKFKPEGSKDERTGRDRDRKDQGG